MGDTPVCKEAHGMVLYDRHGRCIGLERNTRHERGTGYHAIGWHTLGIKRDTWHVRDMSYLWPGKLCIVFCLNRHQGNKFWVKQDRERETERKEKRRKWG